jgi:hypothetical protein
VRVYLAVLILAATVSACSSGNGGRRAETPSGRTSVVSGEQQG